MTSSDATQKGVSAANAAAEPTETLDNNTESAQSSAQHPVKERLHPHTQRASVMERYEAHRKANVPEAAEQGSLDGPGEPEVVEAVEEKQEPAAVADPLDKYIVRKADGVFWKTTVDGAEKLVPIDRAHAQLQKHEAADLRLQSASELKREAERLKQEALAAKPRTPSTPDVSGADDEAVIKEAKELVTSLIEEDEAEATKKLAGALTKARSSNAPVDVKALVDEVAEAVSTKQAQKSQDALLVEGYNAYLKEYGPTVNDDPALRAWHAAKADVLASEHPEWTPKQVMLEAGAQAEKFAGIKRESPTTDSRGTPPAATLATSRTQRKQELQPVPQSRSAVRGTDKPAQVDNSPRAVIEEMRKARGQPVPGSRRVG